MDRVGPNKQKKSRKKIRPAMTENRTLTREAGRVVSPECLQTFVATGGTTGRGATYIRTACNRLSDGHCYRSSC